jgi:O-antigen/teichoic acid export membrane protein
MALVYAVLAQGGLGVVCAFALHPWRPSLALDRAALRPILGFGARFQAKNVMGFVLGAIVPVYGGRALGQEAVGFITWAMETAYFPLNIVAVMSRVSFPLYSRFQNDRVLFAQALERSVQVCAVATLGSVGIFLGLGPNLVRVIFTERWLPALPLFYLFTLAISIGFLLPVLAPALDAKGRPDVTMRLSLFATVLVWTMVPIGTHFWGQTGFVAIYAVTVVAGNVAAVAVLKNLIPDTRFWPPVRAAIVGTVVVAAAGRWLLAPWANGPVTFALAVVLAVGVYLAVVGSIDKAAVKQIVEMVGGQASSSGGRP